MRSRFGSKTYVLALVALTIVPLLALGYVNARELEGRRLETARRETASVVAQAVADQEALLDGARQVLELLARHPAVVGSAKESCGEVLRDLQADNPRYASFGVAHLNGTIWCSYRPLNTTVNIADRAYFKNVLATEDFAVGDYILGRGSLRAVMGVGAPVRDSEGRIVGVVASGIDLAFLTQRLSHSSLPPGGAVTVVDSKGLILARHPDGDKFVGKRMMGNGSVVDDMLANHRGTVTARGIDGVERLYSYDVLSTGSTGTVLVAAGFPQSAIQGVAEAAFWTNLAIVGTVGAVALIVAWAGVVVLLIKPLEKLERAAHSIRKGDLGARAKLESAPRDLALLGQQFDSMAAALERLETARRDFINNAAHQLVTPLTPVRVMSAVMNQRVHELGDAVLASNGEVLVRNVERLARTVDGVVLAARIQARPVSVALADLADIVQAAVSQHRPAYADKGVILEVVEASVATMALERQSMEACIGHLLANALANTPPGGTVTLSVSSGTDGVTVTVSDTGRGFPHDAMQQLFRPFASVHPNETTGIGLGLFFVRDAVERVGGTVFADSEGEGKGAKVGFRIPT